MQTAMDEEKANPGAHSEYKEEEQQGETFVSSEYEPSSEYRVQWRTIAAIISLALGNVCAAMANAVGFPLYWSQFPDAQQSIDRGKDWPTSRKY